MCVTYLTYQGSHHILAKNQWVPCILLLEIHIYASFFYNSRGVLLLEKLVINNNKIIEFITLSMELYQLALMRRSGPATSIVCIKK